MYRNNHKYKVVIIKYKKILVIKKNKSSYK